MTNAIVWYDARTKATADALRSQIDNQKVRKLSGLGISTYFSGVKLRWMMDNVPAVREGIEKGTALFGTIDSWLTWNLTTERAHVTDVTNAGRTMLMNIRTLQWDDQLLDLIGITRNLLPKIVSCSEKVGHMEGTVLEGVPLTGLIGDQQSALVGQACFEVGEGKTTYGTGCFTIVNTGTEPKFTSGRLLTTPGYQLGPKEPCVYSLEGSVAIGGAAVQWLRDKLCIIENSSEVEALAQSVPDTGGMYFVPAFSGLLAPHWREDARGIMVGMTQFTSRAHVARATLASMVFQVNDVLTAISEDMGRPIAELRVDGGACVNNLLMQMQADITGHSVRRPKNVETTALGAAFVAGHAVGYYHSVQAFRGHWKLDKEFIPQMVTEERQRHEARWKAAVQRSLGWVGEGDSSSGGPSKHFLTIAVGSAAVASAITAIVLRNYKK